jgi:arylsulfatase A-like enzyme
MDRRTFLKATAAGIASLAMPSYVKAAGSRKPNVVYLFADQMRAQAVGCMGNAHIKTPNLDRMASQGLLLTNAISCTPVCSPYRAQLMTGRYGHATGVVHNDIRVPDSETMIAEVFKSQGYATGYIGKWHLAGHRRNPIDRKNRRGWDYWAVRNCSHDHFKPAYYLNDSKGPTKAQGWEPDVQTDLAIDYMKANRDKPFCLMVSFGPPHNPYKAPKKYMDMYKGKIPRRPNCPGQKRGSGNKAYYAMVTSLDVCVGRIVKALSDLGIEEDTILCFSSDHGDMLGSQGHKLKQRPWEESINIPFVLRYPRRIAPAKKDWLFASVDVMPTLLGLCGMPIPQKVQGWNLAPTFTGKSTKERDSVFLSNANHGAGGPGTDWRGIRTKEWVYAYHAHGDWVMYDLKNDPYELKNLVDDSGAADRKKQLRAELEGMRKELGESLPLKGKVPAPARTGSKKA